MACSPRAGSRGQSAPGGEAGWGPQAAEPGCQPLWGLGGPAADLVLLPSVRGPSSVSSALGVLEALGGHDILGWMDL